MKFIKRAKAAYIAICAVIAVIGLVLIIFPEISMLAICYFLGIAAIVFGIVKITGYFSSDPYGLAFQFDLAFGIIAIVLGAVVVIHPGNIIALVPIIMGIYFMTDGIMKIQTAVDAKRFGIRRWWLILISAIAIGIMGLLLLVNPFEGAVTLTVLLGITLLADGIANICIAAYTVKAIKKEATTDNKIYIEIDRED